MSNFSDIFRKDVTYDNIKSKKTQGFTISQDDTFLEKTQIPPTPAFKGLLLSKSMLIHCSNSVFIRILNQPGSI